jgi:hypothetical protein
VRIAFPFVVIYSSRFCDFVTSVSRLARPAQAVAIFPNVIVFRHLTHPMNEQWLRHEQIHHYQFWESLGLAMLLSWIEYWYARLVLKRDKLQSYFYKSIEQEAYDNQHDDSYFAKRRPWAFLKYVRSKPVKGVNKNFLPLR